MSINTYSTQGMSEYEEETDEDKEEEKVGEEEDIKEEVFILSENISEHENEQN